MIFDLREDFVGGPGLWGAYREYPPMFTNGEPCSMCIAACASQHVHRSMGIVAWET